MSYHNIKKIVALRRDNMNLAYTLNIDDLAYLITLAAPDAKRVNIDFIYESISQAFIFGYEMGCRAMKKGVPDRQQNRQNKKPCQRANTDKAIACKRLPNI